MFRKLMFEPAFPKLWVADEFLKPGPTGYGLFLPQVESVSAFDY